jgi:uncharacterized protein (DUF1501 family)
MKKNIKNALNRRQFLIRSSGAVSLPILLNGLPLKAFDGPQLQRLFNTQEETDRVLVLVQLNGGNDGLNTVVPLDQMSTYTSVRPGVAIPENKALKLQNDAGLHPSLAGFKELYDENKIGIVQGVSYPNPNQSHFRSNDIWMSGSSADQAESTGWMGRYLNGVYPNYPDGFPNTTMPDPVAIQMTAVVGLTLIGLQHQAMGIALQDPETFYSLISGNDTPGSDLPSARYAKDNVIYAREIQVKSMEYSTVIKAAADKADNLVEYPTTNRLADQLKIVARLIAGGLKTRVYVVQHNGFDTHAAQVDADDPTMGAHANLLAQFGDAIKAFQRDIEALGLAERVVTMSFSEFGRRVASNLSLGTDHGTAAPMFFVGAPVEQGIRGTSPDLEDLDNNNLKMQHDFRQVYASVLQQWFGADPSVTRDVLFGDFSTVKVIKGGGTSSVQETKAASTFALHAVAPHPVRGETTITYELHTSGTVRIDVFDNLGFHVATVMNAEQAADSYQVPFNAGSLPSGTYYVQMRIGRESVAQPMIVVR